MAKKKYIIELEDKNVWTCGLPQYALALDMKVMGREFAPVNTHIALTPYTEPDTDACIDYLHKQGWLQDHDKQITESEYKRGYKNGTDYAEAEYKRRCDDGWATARTIAQMTEYERQKIFGDPRCLFVLERYTCDEAIEKIRQYEQEKEEQIQVGDEVIDSRARIGVCTGFFGLELDEIYVMWRDGSSGKWDKKQFNKTGMHYPGITEAIKKMKERNDVDKNKSGDS